MYTYECIYLYIYLYFDKRSAVKWRCATMKENRCCLLYCRLLFASHFVFCISNTIFVFCVSYFIFCVLLYLAEWREDVQRHEGEGVAGAAILSSAPKLLPALCTLHSTLISALCTIYTCTALWQRSKTECVHLCVCCCCFKPDRHASHPFQYTFAHFKCTIYEMHKMPIEMHNQDWS